MQVNKWLVVALLAIAGTSFAETVSQNSSDVQNQAAQRRAALPPAKERIRSASRSRTFASACQRSAS